MDSTTRFFAFVWVLPIQLWVGQRQCIHRAVGCVECSVTLSACVFYDNLSIQMLISSNVKNLLVYPSETLIKATMCCVDYAQVLRGFPTMRHTSISILVQLEKLILYLFRESVWINFIISMPMFFQVGDVCLDHREILTCFSNVNMIHLMLLMKWQMRD